MPGQLFPLLDAHFNDEELRTLCLMLGLEYESLGGRGKTANARELAEQMRRQGRLPELLALLRQERPHVAWPEPPPDTPPADPLAAYHQWLLDDLAGDNSEYDARFVNLTLLVRDKDNVWQPGAAKEHQFTDLGVLLATIKTRAIVLLGQPGSGKTTLLKQRQLEHTRASQTAVPHQKPASLFVPLNTYQGDPPFEWLARLWQQRQRRFSQLPPFDEMFVHGRLLLLLDGLNEIPHQDEADYAQRVNRWRLFLQENHEFDNTFVFSCRQLDYTQPLYSEQMNVTLVDVNPLNLAQVTEYLNKNLPDRAQEIVAELQKSDQMELVDTPFFLRLLASFVADTGQMPAGRATLLTYFVRRALHREVIERNQRLHYVRAGLLTAADCDHLNRLRATNNPYFLPGGGRLIPELTALAYHMQADRTDARQRHVSLPEADVLAKLPATHAAPIVKAAVQLGILRLNEEDEKRPITFYHHLLQEYFAARRLAQSPDPHKLHVHWRTEEISPTAAELIESLPKGQPLLALPPSGWEETARLAAAMAPDQEAFVSGLTLENLPWAARCAAAPDVAVSDGLKSRLREFLRNRVIDRNADLRARIDAAEALAELGDPRFARRSGPHGDYLTPPLAPISAGSYPIGDDDGYWHEKPAHTVEIAAFEMGVFPVTNAEYALFKRAGGYEDEQWWQTEAAKAWFRGETTAEGPKEDARWVYQYVHGLKDEELRDFVTQRPDMLEQVVFYKRRTPEQLENWLSERFPGGKKRQPDFWDDGRFNHHARPVVGICWFEALAYCAWLSAQTSDVYDLPTEGEWEAAARGKKGRAYAYGPKYDSSLCNTFETHIRRTTPVGVFPGGQTPEGVADLCGNVWEWTTTLWGSDLNSPDFKYPYVADDGRENPHDPQSRRAQRPGRCPTSRRAASRYYFTPASRYNAVGFRVVVRRPPSQ
ncbi:MAG: SUMF1/EgtB/PvdO family nonheme iron enzyme [Ardenticatenaceae bacterium]|nr:SUMF1/EgtB/PvdO family nonheme iron enzyme [Ardenticatenaceae bacterium]